MTQVTTLKSLAIYIFVAIQVVLYIRNGLDIAGSTPEKAIANGMVLSVYLSFGPVAFMMSLLWTLILFAFVSTKPMVYIVASSLFVGVMLSSGYISIKMALESHNMAGLFVLIVVSAVQLIFLRWAYRYFFHRKKNEDF